MNGRGSAGVVAEHLPCKDLRVHTHVTRGAADIANIESHSISFFVLWSCTVSELLAPAGGRHALLSVDPLS